MDELEAIRDACRSNRHAIKSAQKQLRTLLRFVTDLEERIDQALVTAQPREGTANDRETEEAEAVRV